MWAVPTVAVNVVVVTPLEGPVEVPVVVNGYSRNFEANTIGRIVQGANVLAEGFTTAADWSETWGEFDLTLDPAGSGPADLFVGEQSAQDGSDRGVLIPIRPALEPGDLRAQESFDWFDDQVAARQVDLRDRAVTSGTMKSPCGVAIVSRLWGASASTALMDPNRSPGWITRLHADQVLGPVLILFQWTPVLGIDRQTRAAQGLGAFSIGDFNE